MTRVDKDMIRLIESIYNKSDFIDHPVNYIKKELTRLSPKLDMKNFDKTWSYMKRQKMVIWTRDIELTMVTKGMYKLSDKEDVR